MSKINSLCVSVHSHPEHLCAVHTRNVMHPRREIIIAAANCWLHIHNKGKSCRRAWADSVDACKHVCMHTCPCLYRTTNLVLLCAPEWFGMMGLHGWADSAEHGMRVYSGQAAPIHL